MRTYALLSIDVCNDAICGHRDISSSGCSGDKGRSAQSLAWPVVLKADHCHIPCPRLFVADFFADARDLLGVRQSCQSWSRARSPHSARPNRDEYREGFPGHRPPPSTSYLFRVWSCRRSVPFFGRNKPAIGKGLLPVEL